MIRMLLVLTLLALAGCGTIEGMGEDISSGARAVRNAF
ncbi:entericidin A/B family lipoprotein [Rhodovulum euryhalinum]|uniref:Entericidin EcnA/B family protein n=1 Tax=Rhodovulum euryhalinum TaxID=35805 RepID=A0A4R2K8L8_9RHOB|nr:entericidin A/B family lipoprotein [Rhodovulum euryhalinum]TCO69723.1 entericidin EcnA/B family protein [Rhodovulum euryhalinum]